MADRGGLFGFGLLSGRGPLLHETERSLSQSPLQVERARAILKGFGVQTPTINSFHAEGHDQLTIRFPPGPGYDTFAVVRHLERALEDLHFKLTGRTEPPGQVVVSFTK